MRLTKHPTEATTILRELTEKQYEGLGLTDEEMLFAVNDALNHGPLLCYHTYQQYLTAVAEHGELNVEETEAFDPIYRQIRHILMRNRIAQKVKITQQLMETENTQWQKYRWMMEQRFSEFNSKSKTNGFEPKAPLKTTEEKPATKPTETLQMPHLRLVDHDNVDWTDYAEQQSRKIHAEIRGEEFNEQPVPQPAPFAKPYHQQMKEMENERSQMPNEETGNGQMTNGKSPNGDKANEPPDEDDAAFFEEMRKDMSVYNMDELKQNAEKQTPPSTHRQPPKYPPGTKKILGIR